MKTEKEIEIRITKLEGILEAYNEGMIPLAYIKVSKINKELEVLNWVLGKVEAKTDFTKRRIMISNRVTQEEKVRLYLKEIKQASSRSISVNLNIDPNSLNNILSRLRKNNIIKIVGGSGKTKDSFIYSLK